MCKHILNAQVAIRAPCCKKWFDCPACHEESADHELQRALEMVLACKKCKKVFRKDLTDHEADDADEFCPNCDNRYVLEAQQGEAATKDAGLVPSDAQEVMLQASAETVDTRTKNRGQGPTIVMGDHATY